MADPFLGEVRLFGFPNVPVGWLACNGQTLQISEHDALYAVIGTAFGGDGVQTFNLPDLRGRVPIGQGTAPGRSSYRLGQPGGEEQHALTEQEVPGHSHALVSSSTPADTTEPGATAHLSAVSKGSLYAPKADAAPYATMKACITMAGNGKGHDNMMPSVVGNYCICVAGIMPAGV